MGAVTTKVSSFGRISTTYYTLLKLISEELGTNIKICEVGCLDGIYTIPFLKRGFTVDAYDLNEIYLYGGHVNFPIIKENDEILIQRRTIYGAEDRINIEELHDNVTLYCDNFFKNNYKQYDFVFSSKVLHLNCYSDISMKEKIDSLKKSVKNGGILYIEYYIWLDDNNSDNLNSNQFIKQCEMINYFKEGWELLSISENRTPFIDKPHIGNPTFHKHRLGIIKVKRNDLAIPDYFDVNLKF